MMHFAPHLHGLAGLCRARLQVTRAVVLQRARSQRGVWARPNQSFGDNISVGIPGPGPGQH
jgi:hypothetical protein